MVAKIGVGSTVNADPKVMGPIQTYRCAFFLDLPIRCQLVFRVYDKNRELMGAHTSAKISTKTFVQMKLKTDGACISWITVKLKWGDLKVNAVRWKAPFSREQSYDMRVRSPNGRNFLSATEVYNISIQDRPIAASAVKA